MFGSTRVLVEQVNDIGLESLQRSLSHFFDVLRPAIQIRPARASRGIGCEAKLRGDHNLLAQRRQCLTHEFFVNEGAIHFGGIEERDAAFHGSPD
jgi:hypothetical protein